MLLMAFLILFEARLPLHSHCKAKPDIEGNIRQTRGNLIYFLCPVLKYVDLGCSRSVL